MAKSEMVVQSPTDNLEISENTPVFLLAHNDDIHKIITKIQKIRKNRRKRKRAVQWFTHSSSLFNLLERKSTTNLKLKSRRFA